MTNFHEHLYAQRFVDEAYRERVWQVLVRSYFQRFVSPGDAVLDLGCGYGQFINHVVAAKKYAIDLNPASRSRMAPGIEFFERDCSLDWPVPEGSLDVVFTSNFLEHLPDKPALHRTLAHARTALRPGGTFVALGPNVRVEPAAYWDFIDHHLPLSERSLAEALAVAGFAVERAVARFLPYTMAGGVQWPMAFVEAYVRLPLAWRIFGKQFLVIAKRAPELHSTVTSTGPASRK